MTKEECLKEIEKAYDAIFKVEQDVVSDIDCYLDDAPVSKNALKWEMSVRNLCWDIRNKITELAEKYGGWQ